MTGLNFIQNPNDVLNTVSCEVFIIQQRAGFTARACPAQSDHARLAAPVQMVLLFKLRQDLKIDITHGQRIIYRALGFPDSVLDIADLCRARRDKARADLILAQLGMLLDRFRFSHPARHLKRREHRHDMGT